MTRLRGERTLLSEVMKSMTHVILLCGVAFATSVSYGGQEPPGVAGVAVVVKQTPSKHDVTNAWGIFALDALPAGSYTLFFKARPASESKGTTSDKATVATSYSIKIDGARHPVKRSGVTSDNLVAGIEIPVEVGSGAKIRGQVLPGATRKMVWIPPVAGSNLPGHWVEEGSGEAVANRNVVVRDAAEWRNGHR
jgi:hypothetical protein